MTKAPMKNMPSQSAVAGKAITQLRPTVAALIDHYDAFFLDAYGVLVNHQGALPGAGDFLTQLRQRNKQIILLTNDGSRLPETISARMHRLGVGIDVEQIVSSGMALKGYLHTHNLVGANCRVVGSADSRAYVKAAGGVVIDEQKQSPTWDAVIIGDDPAEDWIGEVETVTSGISQALRAGQTLPLILCNPDFIYPKGELKFGFTSGSVVRLIEGALDCLFPNVPESARRFAALGKPYQPIYDLAKTFLRHEKVVMVGDQLHTDVAGAIGAGIDSALVGTGVAHITDWAALTPAPTYVCPQLI